MMNLDPINPYQIIKYLEEENAKLEKENAELKEKLKEVTDNEAVE